MGVKPQQPGRPVNDGNEGKALGTEGGGSLSKSDVFDVLQNERRRAVIRYLLEHGKTATLSDVAEHVAASENDTTVQQLSSQERKRVRIALYQCHLPRMDEFGIVDFDKDRGTITLKETTSQLQRHLEVESQSGQEADGADRVVLAATVGVAAVVTAGSIGLGPLSAIPPAGWTGVSVLALVTISGRNL